jgi:hypothetical protein
VTVQDGFLVGTEITHLQSKGELDIRCMLLALMSSDALASGFLGLLSESKACVSRHMEWFYVAVLDDLFLVRIVSFCSQGCFLSKEISPRNIRISNLCSQ